MQDIKKKLKYTFINELNVYAIYKIVTKNFQINIIL